ncbi:MAG: glutamate-5-semialdehyde dehydrogenase, partial [Clostridia bacterium]|nr:glutamate-5-semialdehyde dehydrogenase [Clostridia bacterium]
MTTKEILINAKAASKDISLITTEQKNEALFTMAQELICASDDILMANAEDLKAAEATVSKVMLDRLMLNKQRIAAMADGIKAVAKLPDPVGQELSSYECENGLSVKKISVPLGVVAIIYESRPNVTSDAAALTLKSGNVCVLRGGKEAFGTSFAIVQALRAALKKCNLNENFINILEDTSRAGANELMTAVGFVDLLIPRGGAGLINACIQNAKVPCIQTGTGICHIYIDKSADIEKALKIVENAKMSRPSVCNAAEVCVVHK